MKKGVFFLVCLLPWFMACSRSQQQEAVASGGEVVARVGSEVITLADFEKMLNSQNRLIRNRYTSLEQRKKLLDSLVERMAMVQEARKLGLEKDPEVLDGLNRLLARTVVNKVFNEKLAQQIAVGDEEIEQYYQQNLERYHAPEKVRVHSIFFAGARSQPKERQAARQKAQKLLDDMKKQGDQRLFIDKARELNEDPEAKRLAGDCGFLTRAEMEGKYGSAFAAAAFSLQQVNQLSELVEEEKGFYLLRQSGRQAAVDLPLDKVKEQIRTTILARKRGEAYQKFVDDIKNKAGIQVFEEALAKAKVDLSDLAPEGRDLPQMAPLPIKPIPQPPVAPLAPAPPKTEK